MTALPAATLSSYVQTVQQVASSTTKDLDIWRSLCWSLIESGTEPYKATRLPRIIQDKLDSQYRPEVFYRQSSNDANVGMSIFSLLHLLVSELDILQKYLLVASYIASFQSAKEDVRAFGSELLKKSKHRRAPFNPAKAKENSDIKVSSSKKYCSNNAFFIFVVVKCQVTENVRSNQVNCHLLLSIPRFNLLAIHSPTSDGHSIAL